MRIRTHGRFFYLKREWFEQKKFRIFKYKKGNMSRTNEINEEIIKKQDEMITILKDLCQQRDKYIALLERQIAITEKYINNEQQQ